MFLGEFKQSNAQDQSQQITKQQNISNEEEHSLNSSETNTTTNQSHFQEQSDVDNFQQNNKSDVANQSADSEQSKELIIKFTGNQQQNNSGKLVKSFLVYFMNA